MVYNFDLKLFMLEGFKNFQDYKLKIFNNGYIGKFILFINFLVR